jgi:hypothetical protein
MEFAARGVQARTGEVIGLGSNPIDESTCRIVPMTSAALNVAG